MSLLHGDSTNGRIPDPYCTKPPPVKSEARRAEDTTGGEITEFEHDDQALPPAFSQAAMALKAAYLDAREFAPGMPPYGQLVGGS